MNDDSCAPPNQVSAIRSQAPIILDGRIDENVWRNAPAYSLGLPADETTRGNRLSEPGHAKFTWDDQCFSAAFDFSDSDVVQESNSDQAHHYRTGDVAELFLKPRSESWYWEFYVTPNGLKSAFFFPGRGRAGLPSCFDYESTIQVAAHVDGTLNNWLERDTGWTATMMIQRREFSRFGIPLDPEIEWQILVGRYNYSRLPLPSGALLDADSQ